MSSFLKQTAADTLDKISELLKDFYFTKPDNAEEGVKTTFIDQPTTPAEGDSLTDPPAADAPAAEAAPDAETAPAGGANKGVDKEV